MTTSTSPSPDAVVLSTEDMKGLIRKAQQGNRGAFDQIVLRCTEHVRALVFSEFGDCLRRRVEVDDLVQDTLVELAERAMQRRTGARALRAVLDEYMLDVMYELPEVDTAGVTYMIDGETITKGHSLAKIPQRKAKESA